MTRITQAEARKKLPAQMEIPATAIITSIGYSDGTSFEVDPPPPPEQEPGIKNYQTTPSKHRMDVPLACLETASVIQAVIRGAMCRD